MTEWLSSIWLTTALAGIFSVHIPGVLGNRCYLWMAVLLDIDAPDDGAMAPFNAGLFAHFLPLAYFHTPFDK